MGNRKPEQDLIDGFVKALEIHDDPNLKLVSLINQKCSSPVHADVEYVSASDVLWAIEAKSNDSRDRYNTVHKMYGNLLTETGRSRSHRVVKFGVLLPESGLDFYSSHVRRIKQSTYDEFGKLIPVERVFFLKADGTIGSLSWQELYAYHSV